MASGEARNQHAEAFREPVEDALGRLEERLDRASQAAERLLADAAQRMSAGTGRPPPAGWQQPAPETGRESLLGADADVLLGLIAVVRDRIPPDLQQRLAEAIREVLLALRALIDWYLERADRARTGPDEIQDIPIL
jgi:hypothetical protein